MSMLEGGCLPFETNSHHMLAILLSTLKFIWESNISLRECSHIHKAFYCYFIGLFFGVSFLLSCCLWCHILQVVANTCGVFFSCLLCRDASRTASSPPTSPRPGSAAAVSAASNVIPPRHQKPAGAPATKKKQQQKKKKGGKGGW